MRSKAKGINGEARRKKLSLQERSWNFHLGTRDRLGCLISDIFMGFAGLMGLWV